MLDPTENSPLSRKLSEYKKRNEFLSQVRESLSSSSRQVMLCRAGDNAIRKTLSEYRPGSIRNIQNVPYGRVCLQLFGMTGHGKSALINSCYCVVKEDVYSNVANSGKSYSGGAITLERKEYKLQDTVYITDNRGMNKLEDKEMFETAAQLCQLRPLGEVDWDKGMNEIETPFIEHGMSAPTDFIVPVFVYSAESAYTPERLAELAPFIREACDITGIFPIIVLTNSQKHNTKDMELQFRELGATDVFPIENYTTTNKTRNPEMDSKILNFLDMCLKVADRGMDLKAGKDLQEEFVKQVVRIMKRESKRLDEEKKRQKEEKRQKEKEKKNEGCIII